MSYVLILPAAAGVRPKVFRAKMLLTLFTVMLAACAVPSTNGAGGKQLRTNEIDGLYAGIDASVIRYRDGLRKGREGQREEGQALMDQAVEELASGGNACVSLPGCEPQRFMAAYTNLLTLRAEELTGEQEGFAEIEALDAASPVLDDLPEMTRSIGLINGVRLAEVIKINGPIKAAMQDWLTWMRPNLIDAYENYQYMRFLMWPAYEDARMPEALLFGMLAKESGGRVHAVSNAGAAGPFQFMYHTGLRFGLRNDKGFDTRYDPQASARANVAYLNEQLRHLNNNIEFALAAYNGGEGRMRRLVQRSRSRSFWSAEIMNYLPRETQEYVPYVLAAAWLFMHPQEYGLEFPRLDATPGEVKLARAQTLSELAVCLGQAEGSRAGWFRTLRNLNPRIDPNKRIAEGSTISLPAVLIDDYATQCVSGARMQLAAELQRARVPGNIAYAGGRKYIVKPGDTLSGIARKQGCGNPDTIARANNIAGPRYMIRPRQELKLVGCKA